MELSDALRTTGSVRSFLDEPVSDEVLYAILDDARFAPSGGNRQAWRVIVVKDAVASPGAARPLPRRMARLHRPRAGRTHPVLAAGERGGPALAAWRIARRRSRRPNPTAFPRHSSGCRSCSSSAPTSPRSRRPIATSTVTRSPAARRSIPFVWSILLAARERGLGGVMTTIATRNEPGVREVLDIPVDQIVASDRGPRSSREPGRRN